MSEGTSEGRSAQARALEVLRAISKSNLTSLQMDDVPEEFLVGTRLHLGRWTMVVSDKNLKKLSEQPQTIYFIDSNMPTIPEFFNQFFEPQAGASVGVLDLDINGAKQVTEYGITMVARKFPNLAHLNIKGCIGIGDVGLREIGMNCHQLQTLNISNCHGITGAGFVAIAEMCRKLLKLNVSNCQKLEKYGLQKVFYECHLIEELDCENMGIVGDDEVRVLAQNCPNLTRFNAPECCYISDAGTQLLAKHCKDLDFVDISRSKLSSRIQDLTLLAFSQNCASLRTLKMSGCEHLTDVGLNWLSEGCHFIETLDLNGNNRVSDAGMRSLAKLHSLTALNICGAKLVSDVGVANISKGCPELKHLNIHGLYLMCDPRMIVDVKKGASAKAWESIIGIQAVGHFSSKLESIDCSGCFRLNISIDRFLSKIETLKKVNLSACNQISTNSLIGLWKGCPLMEDVTLNDCGLCVNDKSIPALVKHCRHLHTLVMHRCPEIRTETFRALSKSRTLTKLDISGCKHVIDMMLLPMTEVDTCPALKTLIMVNCQMVTDVSLAWFASKTQDIQMMALHGTNITKHSVQAVRDRFGNSDKIDNENFLGYWPKFRSKDRTIMNKYWYAKQGWIKIQARQRSWLARQRVKGIVEHRRRKAAIKKLQRMCLWFVAINRVFYKRKEVARINKHAVILTTIFHMARAKKTVYRRKLELHSKFIYKNAVLIQTRYRMCLARYELGRRNDAYQEWLRQRVHGATKFQSIVRMYQAGLRILRIKEMKKARIVLMERKAVFIERCWRGSRGRIKAKERRAYIEWFTVRRESAARQIQRKARINYTNKLVRERQDYKRLKYRSARSVQSLIRGFLCRLVLASEGAEEQEIMLDGAAIMIQKHIRKKLVYLMIRRILSAEDERIDQIARAAVVVQNHIRCKIARGILAELKLEKERVLRERVSMELWGVCKIQAIFRGMLGRRRFDEFLKIKKGKWKELYDEDRQQRFFYNKLTGEIRWRMPQDLLDLIPRPTCDNCQFYEALIECHVCNEVYCQQCWDQVHFGGRRKDHDFRTLFDYYNKRIDYGDGEFPSKWPSEIIQDEVQGWMLRVAPIRDAIKIHTHGWEEYKEINNDGTEGGAFFFNRNTFEATYDQPQQVTEELANEQAWADYYVEQERLEYEAQLKYGSGPGQMYTPAKIQEAATDYAYDPYQHVAHDDKWAENQTKYNHSNYESHQRQDAEQNPATNRSSRGSMGTGRLTSRTVNLTARPPPPSVAPPDSARTEYMKKSMQTIGSTPRDATNQLRRSASSNTMGTMNNGAGIQNSARGKQELAESRRKTRQNRTIVPGSEDMSVGGSMFSTASARPILAKRGLPTPRKDT